jgi:hypothetical protein|tara:strand:- start:669 stop:1307 length:639 start_codon:yes stop_codon:yes gene_type:complete
METIFEAKWFYWEIKKEKKTSFPGRQMGLGQGSQSESNAWNIDKKSLIQGLDKLTELCNSENYEIKAVFPIDDAQAFSDYKMYSDAGNGFGWGVSFTNGFVALLQKSISVSEEGAKAYRAKREIRDQIADLAKERKKLNLILRQVKRPEINKIKFRKGLIGKGESYEVAGNSFATSAEAEDYVRSTYAAQVAPTKKSIAVIDANIAELEKKL